MDAFGPSAEQKREELQTWKANREERRRSIRQRRTAEGAWMPESKNSDPRKVGGRYYSAFWHQEYDVLGFESGWLQVQWVGGGRATLFASTTWDPKRDKIIKEPE